MSQELIVKSVILGVLLFLFDLLVFLSSASQAGAKKTKKQAKALLQKSKARFGFIIPIELFIQVFFALILTFTFRFLLAFNIVNRDLVGSFSYAFIFFVPMLYLLLNSWLWGNKEFNDTLLVNVISWVLKFAVAGLYLGLV